MKTSPIITCVNKWGNLEEEVSLDCSCHCCKVVFNITHDKDTPELTIYSLSFLDSYRKNHIGKLKKIWNIIRGKDNYYAEVCREGKEGEEFKKFFERALCMLKDKQND